MFASSCPPGFTPHVSNENHFAICVPEGWAVQDAPAAQFANMPSKPMAAFGGSFDGGYQINAGLGMKTLPPTFPRSLDAIFQAEWYLVGTTTPNVNVLAQPKTHKIRGLDAFSVEIGFAAPTGQQMHQLLVYLLNAAEGKLYILAFNALASNFEKYRNAFEQMGSTLQII